MNRLRTFRLQAAGWRQRYHHAFSTLLHLRLTIQALHLPDEPAPEQLSERDLDAFLSRLIDDLARFVRRETRYWEHVTGPVRRWRVGELLPLLDLFDETSSLGSSVLPGESRAGWNALLGAFVRLKARVVHLHIFG